MKTLIITIAVMLGLASCSNVSSKNSQVVNIVSYTQIGNDTISLPPLPRLTDPPKGLATPA